MMTPRQRYDYAILGGGAAGLSLLCHLHWSGALKGKSVLLVEPETKNRHDRTWSFWETTPGPFESIVSHRWSSIGVHNDRYEQDYTLSPYTYKVIQSPDFYQFTAGVIKEISGLDRLSARAEHIRSDKNGVSFYAEEELYAADWAFSSLPHPVNHRQIKAPYLDQHFRGWYVRTDRITFDPDHATLMDFRTPQEGETRFLYVLPLSEREAVVEVAIFSNNHLRAEAYDNIIADYLLDHWKLLPLGDDGSRKNHGRYEVYHTEQGVIPMTTYRYPQREDRLLHIGLGGGHARPSTGYTFYNMQRLLGELAGRMAKGENPSLTSPWPRRHLLYDATLLSILQSGDLSGADLFPDLFMRNPTERVLRFLNGETSLMAELKLMSTCDLPAFSSAFVRQLVPG